MSKIETKKKLDIPKLRKIFESREREIKRRVHESHSDHISKLLKKGIDLDNLREVGHHRIAAGALAGALILTPLSSATVHPTPTQAQAQSGQAASIQSVEDTDLKLAKALKEAVPAGYEDLTPAQEKLVSSIFSETLHLKASATIDGRRLNRSFGLIGAEQHLYRYPGDNIFEQTPDPVSFAMFAGAGIAPHVGAYGYFAPSKSDMTQIDMEREKWYVVGQTFLAPGFSSDPNGTAQFFKYRKFLVVNPDTGQAVVGDLADSGPSEYTGKQFGGSPEVMHALGYGSGSRKGRVIFYFLDDPKNEIPLGPIGAR